MQQSSAKRLEERIQSASAEKNKLEGELMTLQSQLKSGKKAKQTLESENTKLSGRLHFINFHLYSIYGTLCEHITTCIYCYYNEYPLHSPGRAFFHLGQREGCS